MNRRLVSLALAALAPLLLIDLTCAQKRAKLPPELQIPFTDDGLPGAGPIRRSEWFQNVWDGRRASWFRKTEEDKGSVVFLGDSITQGWDTEGAFRGLKVANRGISGDTSRGVLIRLKEDVIALDPKAVVLLIGTNDLADKAEPETIVGNVKLIIAALKKHNPEMPIILCKTFPAAPDGHRPVEKIKQINKLYEGAWKDDPQITLLETFVLFADKEETARIEYFPDRLHPNRAGYKKWAAAIRPILATKGLIETGSYSFKLEEGYESLFNSKDLTGWCWRKKKTQEKGETFDGKTTTDDGRFAAINGRLVVTTPPEGRRFQQFWTEREFSGDFTLKLEFRATPFADSGVFIRKPQLQCRDYTLAGPWNDLKKYKPQQWNEIVVVVKDNIAHSTCNGEPLGEPMKLPASGPIGVEGDRGQMEYRRIRIKQESE